MAATLGRSSRERSCHPLVLSGVRAMDSPAISKRAVNYARRRLAGLCSGRWVRESAIDDTAQSVSGHTDTEREREREGEREKERERESQPVCVVSLKSGGLASEACAAWLQCVPCCCFCGGVCVCVVSSLSVCVCTYIHVCIHVCTFSSSKWCMRLGSAWLHQCPKLGDLPTVHTYHPTHTTTTTTTT